jgi:hypothetical protein
VEVILLNLELPPSLTFAWRRSRRMRACSAGDSGEGITGGVMRVCAGVSKAVGVSMVGVVVVVTGKIRR